MMILNSYEKEYVSGGEGYVLIEKESSSCACLIMCCVILGGFAVTGFCIGVPIAIVGLIMITDRGNSTQTTTDSSK